MTAFMLARELALAGVGASAPGGKLVLAGRVPPDLLPAVALLRTGVAALAAGRRWFGCDGTTGRTVALDPGELVPLGVSLLAIEGEAKWHRLPSAARLDSPNLFAAAPEPPRGKR